VLTGVHNYLAWQTLRALRDVDAQYPSRDAGVLACVGSSSGGRLGWKLALRKLRSTYAGQPSILLDTTSMMAPALRWLIYS
jgi:hypothetical protein